MKRMFSWEPQVLRLIDRGDYDQALGFLKELRGHSRSDPELRCILLNEAACLRESGHFKQALQLFQELKKSADVGSYDMCVYLLSEARCLAELDNFRGAKRRLREIQNLDSDGDFALDVDLMEINIQFLEGTLGEAIDNANSFLKKFKEESSDPQYADKAYKLQLRVACDMVNDGQYRRASDAIQQLLPEAKEGDRALLYLYAGVAFEALGESKEAITSFQQVLRENGDVDQLARANYHLGAQYLKNGAGAWAKQHFLEAERLGLPVDISPKDLYRFLADTCACLGELEERDRYARLARL